MTLPILVALVATAATPSWKADILSDDASVRAPVVARMRAKGLRGLYAVQDLVATEPVAAMRARAIRALSELGDAAAEWALRAELRQPAAVVGAAAVRAVVALRLEHLSKLVVARVGDPDPDLCLALGRAVPMMPEVGDAAKAALADPTPAATLAGLEVLSAAGLVVPRADAQRLLASPLPLARLIAGEALGDATAESVFEGLALEPGDIGDRAALDTAKLGLPSGIQALAAMASKGVAPERAVVALGSTPAGLTALLQLRSRDEALSGEIDRVFSAHPPATADLLAIGQGKNGPTAQWAIHLLAERPDGIAVLDVCMRGLGTYADRCAAGLAAAPQAAKTLEHALDSLDPHVRALAGWAVASAAVKPSLEKLGSLAVDPAGGVRAAAALGLARHGEAGFPLLMTLVHDRDDVVRSAAADQLAEQLPADKLAALVAVTLDDDAVRPHLLPALARLPTAAALQLLLANLQHGATAERRQALEQLARFNDPRAFDALMSVASRDPDPDTRTLATRILGN